tara:strand:- start:409 stop:639 length:231 start_codon:yes stop_codon:yes gene_type:complete
MGKFSELDMALQDIAIEYYKRGMNADETFEILAEEMSLYHINASDHEDYINEVIQDAKEQVESTFNFITSISKMEA